ncbi:MAG TPA: NADH-quinone oxidoreductase subunit C [Candidatus Nitrosotenuis sp.]|jgi:NADH:ubiquinone oxidoreductase subunit C|nr:NADH-quinone oxidoreductase subunit C [Candidatus Nitrosotenuis sp.]HIH68756.1 NADH-quinone oxidoreductase subunit C [Candidatus Nitrosotenuis sp.]
MSSSETTPVQQSAPPAPQSSAPPAPSESKQPPVKEIPPFEKSIADKIESQFGSKVKIDFVKPLRIRIKTSKEDVLQVAKFVRDEMHYDHAESVTGVDFPTEKEIEVVYHLGSYTDPQLANQVLALATRAPREENPNPGFDSTRLPSLRDIFYSVEFHERECFEMLGVYFDGHPDNRRLLLPEDWADLPPLRKDFRNKGR